MSNFLENFETGEMWLRYPSGLLYPAPSALSSLHLKYAPINANFYAQLKNNEVLRFDNFYDTIFIETKSGHVFDQIIFEDNSFVPVNMDNRFMETENSYIFLDYWLDEKNKKLYTSINQYNTTSLSSVQIGIIMEQFDIIKNTFNLKLFYEISVNFGSNIYSKTPILEPIKLTYNVDTRKFNISFILRGPNNELGLISSNVAKYEYLTVEETNCVFPFITPLSTTATVNIIDQNLLETDFYS